jgi:hypothetical protein
MYALIEKYGKWVGLVFTLFVVGLLAYLHLADAEHTPKDRQWPGEKVLYICDAPDWVVGNVDEAVELVKPHAKFAGVVKVEGPCSTVADLIIDCEFGDRSAPCVMDAVVLTMAGQDFDFGSMDEGGHGDETLSSWSTETGNITKVTAMFPDDLQTIQPIGENLETPDWPIDAEMLIVAHALLHAEGYDHVATNLPGPFYAEPTGNIMARSITKLGRGLDGL